MVSHVTEATFSIDPRPGTPFDGFITVDSVLDAGQAQIEASPQCDSHLGQQGSSTVATMRTRHNSKDGTIAWWSALKRALGSAWEFVPVFPNSGGPLVS